MALYCHDAGIAGTERLYSDGKFPTPNGRAKLHCVTNKPLYTVTAVTIRYF